MTPPLSLANVQEVATLLKVPVGTIYYWVSRKEIPYIKIGKHLRFSPEQVLDYFKEKTFDGSGACVQISTQLDAELGSLKNYVSRTDSKRKG